MFAVIYISDFGLHAVLRTELGAPAETAKTLTSNPESVAEAPAALFDGSKKRSAVLAANVAARACGVEIGMTAPQAMARCPHLLIRTPRAEAENEARAALLAVGFTVSPRIEDTAPGLCTIDLQGLAPARAERLTARALARLRQLGLPATAGIARTPLLAAYAARSLTPRSARASVSAPAPTPIAAPARSRAREDATLLRVEDEPTFLRPLPLHVAEPSPTLAEVLQGWGLRTLGDLTALPRDEIVRRFGAEGWALCQRAFGGEPRPLNFATPPQTFAAEMDFEDPAENLEPLLFILKRFLDRLTLELRTAQLVAVDLKLTLRLENETAYTRSFRLPEPTGDATILFRTLHTHLESLRTEAAVSGIQLHIEPARPLVRQQGLFDTGLRDPHGFAETLARVAAIVGPDRVGTPQLEDTHRPDAVKIVAPAPVIAPIAAPPVHPPLGLVLRRFRPPLVAKLEFTERQPTYLWTEHFSGAIAALHGPWRSSGDWWQSDRLWSRTEWDVELEDGGVYRLLWCDSGYFVDGEYD